MKNGEKLKTIDNDLLLFSTQKELGELKERFFEFYVLYRLSKTLNFCLHAEELFNKITALINDILMIEDFCIMLVDEKSGELKIWKTNSKIYEEVKDVSFRIGEGITGIVFQSGEPILLNDVSKDERFLYYKGRISAIGSFLSAPLKLDNGQIVGILNLQKQATNGFEENDKRLFFAAGHVIAHTIERIRRYENAQRSSMFDDLTTLYTRRYFLEACHREYCAAERYKKNFSIIIGDIDYFKYFNDIYGHGLGDEILKKLAHLLKSNVRQGDLVCRYGGEEFTILLPETDKEGATTIAQKLRTIVKNAFANEIPDGKVMMVSITFGVATYPENGKTAEEVITAADAHLYLGKESGRDRVVNRLSNEDSCNKSEKRESNRHKTALKIVRGINHIHYVEIKINDEDWRICTIRDVSKKGFKGELELETDIDHDYMRNTHLCKIIMDTETGSTNIFPVRIVHAKKTNQNHSSCYLIGIEILDGLDSWERLFVTLRY
ncbi:MAG: GGDEF domain-containing protein [Planctomycetes bacterium]|nr:GGDEF domain-containing protein [Planctomycetota bacterium]